MNHKELEKKLRSLELFECIPDGHINSYQRVPGGLNKNDRVFIPIKEPFFNDDMMAVVKVNEREPHIMEMRERFGVPSTDRFE